MDSNYVMIYAWKRSFGALFLSGNISFEKSVEMMRTHSEYPDSFLLFEGSFDEVTHFIYREWGVWNVEHIIIEKGPLNSFTNLRIVHAFVNGLQAGQYISGKIPLYIHQIDSMDDNIQGLIQENMKNLEGLSLVKKGLLGLRFLMDKFHTITQNYVEPEYREDIQDLYQASFFS